MNKEQLSHLLHIQKASKEGRLVVFVGAGVSANSGVPTWGELIDEMRKEMNTEYEEDNLKIAQLYKDSRGYKEYMDKVKETLLFNKAVPNKLHSTILSLNPCHIITTNYDDLIEQELVNKFIQYDVVRENKDIPHIVYPNVLVKMHGDYATDNIVLTETDYYNYAQNFALMRAYVQSIFASKLVLFVGFSFADLNLKMILNELQNILSEDMQRAYLLSCKEPDFVTKRYFEKKGINVLYFSEKDIDEINNYEYKGNDTLCGIGLHTDKILYAIKNYNPISKQDLANYLYSRLSSYMNELRSFGDGLKYFFPKDEKMYWNTHSSGLQTGLPYFRNLAKQLNNNHEKRSFLSSHPIFDLRTLLRIAYYNYLYEIDDITIVDERFIANADHYIESTTMHFIHSFEYNKTCKRIKELRAQSIRYTLDDLELPFSLYLLGDYWEAYQMYTKLLPLYWNRKKYILYFICRYNMWSIRYGVQNQKILDGSFDIDKELELTMESDLDEVLRKLPLDTEIKNIFQDLISYRNMGSRNIKTEQLREQIFLQRKYAEKGGCSVNSNIQVLMSLYQRESVFSWVNYIICDNNNHFKSICYNTALGILNSFATPSSTMFGGKFHSTKISELNTFMLEMLIFDISNKELKNILKGYEISMLKISHEGVEYLNSCIKELANDYQDLFKDKQLFYGPLSNLILILSRSKDERIDYDLLYKLLIKYWGYEYHIGSHVIELIIKQDLPSKEVAKDLIGLMLYNSFNTSDYIHCTYLLSKFLKEEDEVFSDIRIDDIITNQDKIKVLSLLYPIIPDSYKNNVEKICLEKLNNLYDYIYFIYSHSITEVLIERFQELLSLEKRELSEDYCFLLSKIRKNSIFNEVHKTIDDLAKDNVCLQFYISPQDFSTAEDVDISWILKFKKEDVKLFLENEIYRSKLKTYITEEPMSENYRSILISFL